MKFEQTNHTQNPKQKSLKENKELIQSFKSDVEKQLKEKLEEYASKADTLTEKDIELIIKISSDTVSGYFDQYGKLLSKYARTFRHAR